MTAQPSTRTRTWMVRGAVAVGTVLIFGALLVAARPHETTDTAKAVVTPPRCTKADGADANVARNGFTLECGPGSAVLRSDGQWHVMKTGDCPQSGLEPTMYFGVHTWRNVPHTGLTLHLSTFGERNPDHRYRINGFVETRAGAEDAVSGTASSSGSSEHGTFIVRGHTSGTTYIGGWTCDSRESAPSPVPVVALPRCTRRDDRNQGTYRDGFAVSCGPASAVILTAGRWQVMNTGVCGLDNGSMMFGVHTTRHVAHSGLALYGHLDPRPGHVTLLDPGEIETVPGVREQTGGGMTFGATPEGGSGTFIIGGEGPAQRGGYIGAWDCGR